MSLLTHYKGVEDTWRHSIALWDSGRKDGESHAPLEVSVHGYLQNSKTLRACLSLFLVFLPSVFSKNWRDKDLMDDMEWIGYSYPESSDLWLNVQLRMCGVPQDLYWDMDFIHETGDCGHPQQVYQ